MTSANIPCRNTKLCGVQSHRPGTVAKCIPGRSGQVGAGNLTSKLSGTPSLSSSEPHISEKIQAILDRPEGYRTETPASLSSEEALELLRAKLLNAPLNYEQWKFTANPAEREAYNRLQEGGYYDYPDKLKDESFLDQLADAKGMSRSSVKSAAAMMVSEHEQELNELNRKHAAKAEQIIANTPFDAKYVKSGMRVVVDDGTEGGRIVKVYRARNGKIWGETIDDFEDTDIDGWGIDSIRVPK